MPLVSRLLLFATSVTVAVAQDLPAPAPKPLDFEPQLILTDPNAPPAGGFTSDLVKMENGLQRAKRNAAADEKLYKQGILAKVEAERSAMKVVVLTSNLSAARLEASRLALANLQEGSAEARAAAQEAVTQAEKTAKADLEVLHKAQIEAAALNVWRLQKLEGWGSASKAAVAKAQEQLATLQKQQP